jgi:hypothetical protein
VKVLLSVSVSALESEPASGFPTLC